MSKAMYVGVDGKARKVKKIYAGVDGVAHEITKTYVGVNGIAQLTMSSVKPKRVARWGVAPASQYSQIQAAAVTIGNYGIYGGGVNQALSTVYGSVDIYDSMLVKRTTPALSQSRRNVSATSLQNIYAMFAGGSAVSASSRYNIVDVYDNNLVRSNPVTLVAAKRNVGAASIGDYAIFFGGHTTVEQNTVDAIGLNLVRVAGPVTGTPRGSVAGSANDVYALFAGGAITGESTSYSVVTAINANLASFAAAALPAVMNSGTGISRFMGHGLIAGGYNISSTGTYTVRNTCVGYPSSLVRVDLPNLQGARCSMGGTVLGEFALFFAGLYMSSDGTNTPRNYVDIYDKDFVRINGPTNTVTRKEAYGLTVGNYALALGGNTVVDVYTLEDV